MDPDLFKGKPTGAVVFGIFLILFSYVIGWPAVAVFGWLSFHTGQPLILVVGGPVTYGLSHLVFMAGVFLAGKPYVLALAKRATRAVFERLFTSPPDWTRPDPGRQASGKGALPGPEPKGCPSSPPDHHSPDRSN